MLVAAGGIVGARRYAMRVVLDDLGPLYTVREGPLTISVNTAGTIQSRRSAVVRSAAEGRNTIIWIIDEGRTVTNNQLLVELDASSFVDRKTDQQIYVGNAEAALTASQERLAIARIEQESSVLSAELKLHLATLEQEKYQKGEHPQTLQEAESRIAMAGEEVERATENLSWTRRLAEEGYLTRSEMQADEMALKQKRISHEAARTAMNVLTNYSSRQQEAILASNLRQAKMELERVQRQTRANVIQAESDLRAKQLEVDRQRTRLENLERQIVSCRILAPTNGVVIYHSTMQSSRRRWGGEPLQAGLSVVERQELIHIPIDDGMIVELSVPESSLIKLKQGQAARIKVDALPGAEYWGRLSKIGLLPDGRNAWLNPDLQLYNCEIDLENYENLRSGMNCETDMQVEHHEKTLFVPIQCVLRFGDTPVVYLAAEGRAVRRAVRVGLDNGRMIHILDGLAPGDQVLLDPPLEEGSVQEQENLEIDGAGEGADGPAAAAPPVVDPSLAPPAKEPKVGGKRERGGGNAKRDAAVAGGAGE